MSRTVGLPYGYFEISKTIDQRGYSSESRRRCYAGDFQVGWRTTKFGMRRTVGPNGFAETTVSY